VYLYICVNACIYVHIYTHMYIYIILYVYMCMQGHAEIVQMEKAGIAKASLVRDLVPGVILSGIKSGVKGWERCVDSLESRIFCVFSAQECKILCRVLFCQVKDCRSHCRLHFTITD